MDFGLDETQQAIADLAANVLRESATDSARAAAALATDGGYDETSWKALAQAGLLSLALPTDVGGDGFGAVEVALVLTEVGRQVLPLPALATLALGVLPVVAFAPPDLQRKLLAGVGDGAVLTAALRGAEPVHCEGDVLIGTRVGVPCAAQAAHVLVPVEDRTAVVAADAPGVSLVRTPSASGAPEYTVRFAGTPIDDAFAATAADVDRFAICGAAAVADGVLAGALALTAEHLRSRVQFGRPLATFQAVAQEIADVYVVARTVHLAAVSLAWRLGTGRDADEDAAVAAYWLGAELPRAVQVCHHLHGGLGVDITYPLHRYYSQAKDLARLVGGAAARLEALGDRCCSN